jgi:hypothetical protein
MPLYRAWRMNCNAAGRTSSWRMATTTVREGPPALAAPLGSSRSIPFNHLTGRRRLLEFHPKRNHQFQLKKRQAHYNKRFLATAQPSVRSSTTCLTVNEWRKYRDQANKSRYPAAKLTAPKITFRVTEIDYEEGRSAKGLARMRSYGRALVVLETFT